MPSFDQLREPLDRALVCARRMADLSHAEVMSPGTVQDEIGRLNRKLPRLNKQVMTAFQGDARLVAELLHDMKRMKKDASDLADWTSRQSKELFELNEAIRAADDSADKITLMWQKPQAILRASAECQKRQGVVYASCERAYLKAVTVCAAADEAAVKQIAEPSAATISMPVPEEGDPKAGAESAQVLSERQYDILEAMYNLKATDPARRKTTDEIAKAAEGPDAAPEGFKRPIADLVRRRLAAAKTGRGGGCWLTCAGRSLAEDIQKR